MEAAQDNTAVKRKKKLKMWYPATGKEYREDKRWFSSYWRKFLKPTLSFRWSPATYFDNRACIHMDLLWISMWIYLPVYSNICECDYPEFGFYYHNNSLVLCWNMKKKFIHMPWTYTWVRTSRMLKDGSWEHEVKGGKRKEYSKERDQWELENIWQETHHYTYVCDNGEIQDDIEATIKVEEREWRQKWLMWTKWFRSVDKTIAVEFSKEVGNQRGSWKGGTMGCGYTMKKGETPLQTLRRMRRERSFCR